jgi:hypothetical protein
MKKSNNQESMFSHCSIHKYTWNPEAKRYNLTDHVFTDDRRHPSVVHARFFKRAECDTDNYLVTVKLREIVG